jgi:2-polyprenyl-6-hydroxyphenyl methylase/3-demethylubiquinone-9 3-methyltransferase
LEGKDFLPAWERLMASPLTRFTQSQQHLSKSFDRLLPTEYQVDGNRDFIDNWIDPYLKDGSVVYDIGGGKNPVVALEHKQRRGLCVVGLDIDGNELAASPSGVYDQTICADITQYRGQGQADVVVCQALLEHVKDTQAAIRAIASILKPGGTALIFLPSRNAVFARINLMLPQQLKRTILHSVFPSTKRDQGFPAYYDHCTPADFRRLAADSGLAVDLCKVYFRSSYFMFFFPLHLGWRIWQLIFRLFAGEQGAETFSLALRKI